jgi:glycosyltransferase involved in cell wall biosynthesis
MDLSVLLATWNNSARLAITLDAIAQCRVPAGITWELVVVNNNCTDDTDAVVASFRHRLPLLLVHEPVQGLSRARNAGVAAASGDLIIFTDDDVRPCPEWILVHWAAYQKRPKGHYFGGPIESEFEGSPPPKELLEASPPSVRGLDWGDLERALTAEECFVSANWACPTAALRSTGGFDVTMGLNPASGEIGVGEETDLMGRLSARGMTPWYLPGARLRHFVPASKCTLAHVVGRARAGGRLLGKTEAARYVGPRIAGVPRWAVRAVLAAGFRLAVCRASGRRNYGAYVDWYRMVEYVRAARQAWRQPVGTAARGQDHVST